MATILEFPRGGISSLPPACELESDDEQQYQWTVSGAVDMARQYHRLRRESYRLKDKLAREAAKKVERPTWKPEGAGYENLTLCEARSVILEHVLCMGPEEVRLAVSYKAYVEVRAAWQAERKRLTASARYDRLEVEAETRRAEYDSACKFLQEHGIHPYSL